MNTPGDRHELDVDEHDPRRAAPAPLGPLLATFRTRRDAEQVGPYELARIFAALPWMSPGPPRDEAAAVHELAVVAALGTMCAGWVGLHIHSSLDAGTSVDEVAAAAGLDRREAECTWRSWADAQLRVEVGGRPLLARDTYDRVAGRFAEEAD